MTIESSTLPFYDLAKLPEPPVDYQIESKADSEYLKHTVNELKALLDYHAFGFAYTISRPRVKTEYLSLLKKLHYSKPSITSKKADGFGIVSPLLCHGDVGPGSLPLSTRERYDLPAWSLTEQDAIAHIQPHKWLRDRNARRPKAQDPTTTTKGNLLPAESPGIPSNSTGPGDRDPAIDPNSISATSPASPLSGTSEPSSPEPFQTTSQITAQIPSESPLPFTEGGFTTVNPSGRFLPGLGALSPKSANPSPPNSFKSVHSSSSQLQGSSTNLQLSAQGNKRKRGVPFPSLGNENHDTETKRIGHLQETFPYPPPQNIHSSVKHQNQARLPELRRDVAKAAERLVYGYVYHGLFRHPSAPPKPQPPNQTALTLDDVRKAMPMALRANAYLRLRGNPYLNQYYGLDNDSQTSNLLQLNQASQKVQPAGTQSTSARAETTLDVENQVDNSELGPMGTKFLTSDEPREYRFYGRGPVYQANSCYLDTVITACLLLDAGMTIADRASEHDSWYENLERTQKELVDALSVAWDFASDHASITQRDLLRGAYRRVKNKNLAVGDPGYLRSDGQAPVAEVWSRLLGPFGQFNFTGIRRTTPCPCRGAREPIYSPQQLHHTVTPDHEEQDSHGVHIQTLMQRCFSQRRVCRQCKQGCRLIDEIITDGDLPLRLVLEPHSSSQIIGHTSSNIKIKYYRRETHDDRHHLEEATYRYLGGIYYLPSISHFVLAWMPPCTSPTHHSSPCASDEEAGSILLYDSTLISGSIIGMPVPPERLEKGEKVPQRYMQSTPPILFYERVLDPSMEVLDEVNRVVSRMSKVEKEMRGTRAGMERSVAFDRGKDDVESQGIISKVEDRSTKTDNGGKRKRQNEGEENSVGRNSSKKRKLDGAPSGPSSTRK